MQPADQTEFENEIRSLEATAASAGMHLEIDSTARRIYAREITNPLQSSVNWRPLLLALEEASQPAPLRVWRAVPAPRCV